MTDTHGKDGYMAKYVQQKEDEAYKFIEEMTGMIMDVNPSEIASHIENNSLREWCISWQAKAQTLIVTAPLKYEHKKSMACFTANGNSYKREVSNAKIIFIDPECSLKDDTEESDADEK